MKVRHLVLSFPNYIFTPGSETALEVRDVKDQFYVFNTGAVREGIPEFTDM